MILRSIDDPMPDSDSKSIMRSLGEFVGHVVKGIKTDPAAPQVKEVGRSVETEDRGDVVLRRTTIDEVELRNPPESEKSEPSPPA